MPNAARPMRLLLTGLLIAGCQAPVASTSPGPSSSPGNATGSPSAAPSTSTPTATVAPNPSPTIEPDPTVPGALPPRTEVETNPNVQTRAGVPDDLQDLYWWTYGDAGRVATTAQVGLPADEHILDVRDGLVIAERRPEDRAAGAMLVVREFASGAIVREFPAGVTSVTARIVGRKLVWTGVQLGTVCNGDEPMLDGGVWTSTLDLDAEPVAIVAPGTPVSPCFSGRLLISSPSGETIGAVMTSYGEANWIDVIDAATLTSLRRLERQWSWAITDTTAMQWDTPPTDYMAPGSGVSAYNLTTGAVRWRFPGKADRDRFAPHEIVAIPGGFAMQYAWWRGDDVERIVAAFDARTGQRRELFRAKDAADPGDLWLEAELSAGGTLALLPDDESIVNSPISVIDVATGELTRDVFVIDPPFLCFPDPGYCLRD